MVRVEFPSIILVSFVNEGSSSTTTFVTTGFVSMTLFSSVMIGFPPMNLVTVVTSGTGEEEEKGERTDVGWHL